MTISIRSTDMGYDLRAVGQEVILPADTDAVLCDMPERNGYVIRREDAVTGTHDQIVKRLRGLGYRVRFALR